VLGRLLALSAPMSSLQNALQNKGLKFTTFHCPIEYIDKKLKFNECVATSNLFAVKITGNIDLDKNYLDARCVLVPQNIFNTLIAKMPIINILSGGKNEGMILSTLFSIDGYLDKEIKIKANYLSTFTLGFLKDILKKPLNNTPKENNSSSAKD
jgi:hypothetical protein